MASAYLDIAAPTKAPMWQKGGKRETVLKGKFGKMAKAKASMSDQKDKKLKSGAWAQ